MEFISSLSITNRYFSLTVEQDSIVTQIDMHVFSSFVTTRSFPKTYRILQQLLPSIHTSQCFNENNYPFAKEVKHTEIGHLFEHILLEYLYGLKVLGGYTNVVMKGETSWNWEKDPWGYFHIQINVGKEDIKLLEIALEKSINLIEIIFNSREEKRTGVKPTFSKTLPPKRYTQLYAMTEKIKGL